MNLKPLLIVKPGTITRDDIERAQKESGICIIECSEADAVRFLEPPLDAQIDAQARAALDLMRIIRSPINRGKHLDREWMVEFFVNAFMDGARPTPTPQVKTAKKGAAADGSKRNPAVLGQWGPTGTRVVAAETKWREVLKWNREALEDLDNWKLAVESCRSEYDAVEPYIRPRVFCASLADVFEDWTGDMLMSNGDVAGREVAGGGMMKLTMQDVRARLFALIGATPALDWLLLTKRPENLRRMLPVDYIDTAEDCDDPAEREFFAQGRVPKVFPNVWLGTTVENRAALPRIDVLRSTPAAVRFLSCEPLIEDLGTIDLTGIHWVIVGGESGGCETVRPFNLDWARSIVKQCRAAAVPVFVKQLGAVIHARNTIDPLDQFPESPRFMRQGPDEFTAELGLIDRKGGDLYEWPADLRVREFPN